MTIRARRRAWEGAGADRLLKPAATLAIVVLAFLVGQGPSRRWAVLVVLVVGGGAALIVLMRHPQWGLLALVPASLMVPWEMGTGTKVAANATVVLVPLLAGVWVLRMVLSEKEVRLSPSPVNLPALAFAAATTVSLIAGGLRWITFGEPATLPAQIGGWALYVFPMALLLLAGNQVSEVRWLRALVWLFLALSGAYIVCRAVPALSWAAWRLFVGEATGCMFWTWLAALSFSQALLNDELRPSWRLVLGGLAILTLYVGWSQGRQWISGWLPPLVAVIVITWLRSWRLGLAVTLIGGALLAIYYPTLAQQVYTAEQEYSTISRAATWPIMLDLIRASPVLGLGPSNYYRYTPLYSLWGWNVVFNSHNNYLDIIAQTGLVGLAAFGWLIYELGRVGWRLRQRVQDGFGRAYVVGALGGLVAMLASGMMADWFLPFTYNIGFAGFRAAIFGWLFLGGLVALDGISRRTEAVGDGEVAVGASAPVGM